MKNRKLTGIISILLLIALGFACEKDLFPTDEELSVLGYSNLRWDGGDNHYWSVYTINSDGSNDIKIIESDIGLKGQEWSPDGTKILVCGMVTPTSPHLLYVMNADGTNLQNLSQMTEVSLARWSPDGNKITFTKFFPEQNYRSEIWMMNADGADQKSITDGQGSSFFANGTKLIYTSSKTGNSEIYSCNNDGSNQLKITNTVESESNVDVSPDGTMLIYTLQTNIADVNTWEICLMNMDGTNVTKLTNNNFLDEQARWSHDGTHIAFISSRGSVTQSPEVYIMNGDGTTVRKVTNANERSNSANLPTWKPKV
jgi:TolB protein